jgi:hypothetical protein
VWLLAQQRLLAARLQSSRQWQVGSVAVCAVMFMLLYHPLGHQMATKSTFESSKQQQF